MKPEQTPIENTELVRITTGLQSFEERKESLIKLAESAAEVKINGLEDRIAYRKVREKRIEIRNAEIQVEKEAKAMRDLVTPISRHISAKENELLEITAEQKKRLIAEEKWFDDENERIQKEILAMEKARIQARIDSLAKYGAAIDYSLVSGMSDEEFTANLEQAKAQFEAEQQRLALEKIENDRIEKERQQKLEAERIEIENTRAEQAKIQKEQQEKEAAIKRQQEEIALQKEAIEKSKRDEEDRKKRDAELEASKIAAKEQAIKDLESKIKEEKAEADRQARLLPDKEKLIMLVGSINNFPRPELKSEEAKKLLGEILAKFDALSKFIISEAEKL